MVCHGELARLRPPPARLTEFYLFMSLGGVLGGAFTALLAPLVFDVVLEYPLMLVFACALRPMAAKKTPLSFALDVAWPGALAGIVLLPWIFQVHPTKLGVLQLALFLSLICVMAFFMSGRPLRFALAIAAILAIFPLYMDQKVQFLERERSFFGVYAVVKSANQRFNVMMHGTTIHGVGFRDEKNYLTATTYYHAKSPIGRVLRAAEEGGWPKDVGAIGLGVATISCYSKPGQRWTYYEIDPVVERIARDTRYYHYLELCGGETDVVLGDARLKLAAAADGSYDLLVLDAFSSDAIPVHLLTREAIALYLRKLKPGGVVMIHTTNRHLNLEPVLAEATHTAGLAVIIFREHSLRKRNSFELTTSWVALARRPQDLMRVKAADKTWKALKRRPGFRLWTDDFSNLLSILNFEKPAAPKFNWR